MSQLCEQLRFTKVYFHIIKKNLKCTMQSNLLLFLSVCRICSYFVGASGFMGLVVLRSDAMTLEYIFICGFFSR